MKGRSSNIELYRIILMLLIVAHHYVVNTGLLEICDSNPYELKSMYLHVFGAWGKMAINGFILITGYFMCKNNISIKKWAKFFLLVVFYRFCFYMLLIASGHISVSFDIVRYTFIPIISVLNDFISCYLLFYLFIPFLNILVNAMNEKQHACLALLSVGVFSVLGTVPRFPFTMNYITWFCVVYLLGAYIRIYPKEIYLNHKLWGMLTILFSILSVASILILPTLGFSTYFLVMDSNRLFALIIGITSFVFFVNLPINYNKYINLYGGATFGVLLIHANSGEMTEFIWNKLFKTIMMYDSDYLYIHSVLVVIVVYIGCTAIEIVRQKLLHLIRQSDIINCMYNRNFCKK